MNESSLSGLETTLEDDNEIEGESSLENDTINLFSQLEKEAKICSEIVVDLIDKLKNKELSTKNGLSFLEVKNNLLLSYIQNLTGIILKKANGESIQNSSFLNRLIDIRVYLEKMMPIEQKLKYQIDKLIRSGTSDGKSDSDPLKHRPNLNDLVGNEDENSSSDDDDDEKEKEAKKESQIYKPPKIAPQYYDDDDDEEATPVKAAERQKKKIHNRSLIRELQEEYLDTPVEIHNMGDGFSRQLSRETKDKTRYEETYMTRLTVTKKDKHNEKLLSTLGQLGDEITDFSSKRRHSEGSNKKGSGKRKSKGGGKGTKKRFRKK